jgi:hypothetical protein
MGRGEDGTEGKPQQKKRGEKAYLLRRIPYIRAGDVFCLVAKPQVTQLVALVEHVVPDSNVDDGGQHDARPDRHVVEKNAELVVVISDPAPQLGAESSAAALQRLKIRNVQRGDLLLHCRRFAYRLGHIPNR